MKGYLLLKKGLNLYCSKWWTIFNKLSFKLNGVKYGKNLSVKGKIYLFFHYDDAKIVIGDNVTINSAGWANPIGTGDKTYFQMLQGAIVTIGNCCGISNTAFTCASSITIEDNVLLGAGCKIYDTDFHSLKYSERIKGNYEGAPIKIAPILIKEGAFIGAGSYILKGVTVGKHSIVGAGSVVTKNIPDYEIWAGNPARFLKKVCEVNDDKK